MKVIEVRGIKSEWNEKFYGKKQNVIYLNGEKLELTEEEVKSVLDQQYKEYTNKEEVVDFQEAGRKAEIIANLLKEIDSLTTLKETTDLFKYIQSEMVDILKRKSEEQ